MNLHTEKLINDFSVALKEKLAAAETKYGFSDEWRETDWEKKCQGDLANHLYKGDPRDVAAYCAFCWYHGWSTVSE